MDKWTNQEMEAAYTSVLKMAAKDPEFRKELVENPNRVISNAMGKEIPDDYKIRVIDYDPAYSATFFLPDFSSDELTADDLDAVAGGSCAGNVCGANGCAGQITK